MKVLIMFIFCIATTLCILSGVYSQEPLDDGNSSTINSHDTTTTITTPYQVSDSTGRQQAPIIADTSIVVSHLDFAGTTLYDALTAIARAYNLSLFVDSSVTGTISLRLDNVLLNDALQFIFDEYHLGWQRSGKIVKVYRIVSPPPPPPPLDIVYHDSLLSLNVTNVGLKRLVDTLITMTGDNIVIEGPTLGTITGRIVSLPVDKALAVLLPTNGYSIRTVDDVIYIDRADADKTDQPRVRNLRLECDDGLVTLSAEGVDLTDVLRMLSNECGLNISIQADIRLRCTASFVKRSYDEALTYLLLNTDFTFRAVGGTYFIGDKKSKDLHYSKLIVINHMIASTVAKQIPASLSEGLTITEVTEHNGLLLTGPRTSIAKVEDFIATVDVRPAQVLFEVLVVDYTKTDRDEFSITANNSGAAEGQSETYWPGINVSASGSEANDALRSLERHLGWSNLGVLDDDFFVQLQWMQQKGKAIVQSHPRIATLNGHSASIKIGTTQYYLLETETVYPSQQSNVSTQTSQRFETIEANMSLVVTPYVSRQGDLIVEIKPEFTTPTGDLTADVPPTLNHRLLESTLRLHNGETIVLGGLVQRTKRQTIDKVPLLGSIPLLGKLFQNRSSEDVSSELMVYVTPYVQYGSEGRIDLDSVKVFK